MIRAQELARGRVGVVIPAYCEGRRVQQVIAEVPAWVEAILVVDDASTDDTAALVAELSDPRLVLLRHEVNRGVGGATKTGFAEALRRGLEIVAKVDGDGQMDLSQLERLVAPLIRNEADMVKGNRYASLDSLAAMPAVRVIGNAGLSFLVKLASGYWRDFDPANGYLAVRTSVLRSLRLERLPERYYFESGFLVELGIIGAAVRSVSLPARYGDEESGLSVVNTLFTFPPRLLWGLVRRVFWRYFVHDFSPVSLFLLLGLPSVAGGILYGLSVWSHLTARNEYASAGMVMLAAMPIIIGFQLLIQALVMDIQNVPRIPLSPPFELAEPASALSSAPGAQVAAALGPRSS